MLFKISMAVVAGALLASCGGGGGVCGATLAFGGAVSSQCSQASGIANPLKKYEGSYYMCDGNRKTILRASVSGSRSLNVHGSAEVYSGARCTGSVIGLFAFDAPSVVTYSGSATANLPAFTVFPYSDSIDRVLTDASTATATLSGSNVSANCVNYSYVEAGVTKSGSHCFSLTQQVAAFVGGLYLSADDQYLTDFTLANVVQTPGTVFSRSPSFNIDMLVAD